MQMVIEHSARLRQEVQELLDEAAEALALAETVGEAGALDLQRYAKQLKAEANKLQAMDSKVAVRKPCVSGGWSIPGLLCSIITIAIVALLA